MQRLWPLIGCNLAAGLFAFHAAAAELNEEALSAISRAANDICGEFLQSGSSTKVDISGEANARLKGLIKELVDLGVGGAAHFDTEEFVNVAQDDLADELASMRDCRLRIWNDLKDSVTGAAAGEPGETEVAHCGTKAILCAVPETAFEAGDLLIVQLRLEQFKSRAFLGIMKDSFRAVSSAGAVYQLSDSGGLVDCGLAANKNNCGIRADLGDVVPLMLTFQRVVGKATDPGVAADIRVTGNVMFAGSERAINLPGITLAGAN